MDEGEVEGWRLSVGGPVESGNLLVRQIVEKLSHAEMKPLLALFIALFAVTSAWAFDPAGPPPRKTLEWTIQHLTNAAFPMVAIEKDTILEDCIAYMNMTRPAEYSVRVDASALGKEVLGAPIQVGINARNIKMIDFLAKIAEAAQANIVIEAGKVRLIPRAMVQESGVDDSTRKPAAGNSPDAPAQPKP